MFLLSNSKTQIQNYLKMGIDAYIPFNNNQYLNRKIGIFNNNSTSTRVEPQQIQEWGFDSHLFSPIKIFHF